MTLNRWIFAGMVSRKYDIPPQWRQGVNWAYIRRSEDAQDVFWTSYVRSIYVLCLLGHNVTGINSFFYYTSLENRPFVISLYTVTFFLFQVADFLEGGVADELPKAKQQTSRLFGFHFMEKLAESNHAAKVALGVLHFFNEYLNVFRVVQKVAGVRKNNFLSQ